MKTKILSYIAAGVLVALASGCGDVTIDPVLEGTGKLSFANFGVTVETSQSVTESRAEAIDVSNYRVTILDDKDIIKPIDGKKSTPFNELPGVVNLKPGSYTIKVESHEVKKAEWDNPYYKGETKVTIEDDKVADAGTVECKFASMRVSVAFSSKLSDLLGDDVTVTVDVNDGGHIVFTKEYFSHSAYFEVIDGSTTLIAHLEGTINGVPVDKIETYSNVKAGQHHTIRYKVQGLPDPPEETGSVDPVTGIQINQTLETVDQNGNVTVEEEVLDASDRPGQETPDPNDPNTPDDPTPPTPPTSDAIKISASWTEDMSVVTDAVDGQDYIVNITAEKGFAHINVEIKSAYLTDEFLKGVGLAAKFDLAEPGAYEEGLNGLGIKTGKDVVGKTETIFDLTQFIPMLNFAEEPMEHAFVLTVIDMDKNTNSVTLKFKSE